MDEMIKVTGWQRHTVWAIISIARKTHNLKVELQDGVYRAKWPVRPGWAMRPGQRSSCAKIESHKRAATFVVEPKREQGLRLER